MANDLSFLEGTEPVVTTWHESKHERGPRTRKPNPLEPAVSDAHADGKARTYSMSAGRAEAVSRIVRRLAKTVPAKTGDTPWGCAVQVLTADPAAEGTSGEDVVALSKLKDLDENRVVWLTFRVYDKPVKADKNAETPVPDDEPTAETSDPAPVDVRNPFGNAGKGKGKPAVANP